MTDDRSVNSGRSRSVYTKRSSSLSGNTEGSNDKPVATKSRSSSMMVASVKNPAGNPPAPAEKSSTAVTSNIQIAVRCRPLSNDEKQNSQSTAVTNNTVKISSINQINTVKISYGQAVKKINRTIEFDRVFGMYSNQNEVYDTMVKPTVEEAMSGFNCTVFAYGPTGTGKTFTMEGDVTDDKEWGMIPHTTKTIFNTLQASGADFTVKVSYLEIYNEELQDLLCNVTDKRLKLMEDLKRGVICHNLEEFGVFKIQDVMDLLKKGALKRQTAATRCNDHSSRSHAIFTFRLMIKESSDCEDVMRQGQLNLVDLAGSESIARSGAKDERAREAGSINQSLLTLGRVITALVDLHPHIPYRDSKLTRLLQDSLGGKAKTTIISTVSPSHLVVEETLSTLDYAARARNIKNQPIMNAQVNGKIMMKEYYAEIEHLKAQLLVNRERNGIYVDPDVYYGMEQKIAQQENHIQECEGTIKLRDKELLFYQEERLQYTETLESYKSQLRLEIQQLIYKQKETETYLTSTFSDLIQSEGIIAEQVNTEKELIKTSKSLQQTLDEKQQENYLLLTKVEILEKQESIRLELNESFVRKISIKNETLLNTMQQSLATTEENHQQVNKQLDRLDLLIKDGTDNLFKVLQESFTAFTKEVDESKTNLTQQSQSLKVQFKDSKDLLSKMLKSYQESIRLELNESFVRKISIHACSDFLLLSLSSGFRFFVFSC